MELKIILTCLVIHLILLVSCLIQSASLSSADKNTMLNVITRSKDSGEHQSLFQAVRKIIRSLDGDMPSAMISVIKVTSHDARVAASPAHVDGDARYIDPFTETIVRNINVLFEFYIQDYDGGVSREATSKTTSTIKRTRNHALVILSQTMSSREIEVFLLSHNFESQKKVLIVVLLDETFSPLRNQQQQQQHHIKLMLDIMWRKFILNVHVVTQERNGDVHLNTYFPFTKDFCGQVHPVVWNIYRSGAFVATQSEHFPRKDENLWQCSLDVAVFNAPPYMTVLNKTGTIDVGGVDGNLVKSLAKKINFTINYVVLEENLRWGEIYANQTATGAIGMVRRNLTQCSSEHDMIN